MSEIAVASPLRAARRRFASRWEQRPTLVVVGWVVLAIHIMAWGVWASLLARPRIAAPSVCVLVLGTLMFFVSGVRRRQLRAERAVGLLVIFFALSIAMPLPKEYAGAHFMGDGTDYATDRRQFDRMFPLTAGRPELQFKSHLSDLMLATVDRTLGRTTQSMPMAYEVLSRIGGLLFLSEIALLLVLTGWSPRACRFAALALATPLSLTFFGYYENGYLAASIAAFPLLAIAFVRRSPALLHWSGAVQGLHAALHGFGILGIGGGILAALSASRRGWSRWAAAAQFGAFATATYLGWVVLYTVGLKVSLVVDQAVKAIAIRGWTDAYYFDQRLVEPLTTFPAVAEVGIGSLAAGVPVLVAAVASSRVRSRLTQMALAFALPALAFLIVWWPSPGVYRDMDLFLGSFGAIGAAAWICSRRRRTTWIGLALLALAHVCIWTAIGDDSLGRTWIED